MSSDASGVASTMSTKVPRGFVFSSLSASSPLRQAQVSLPYRYYSRPVTLIVAVGSIDGEAAKEMSATAGELLSANAPVRLRVIDSGTAREAAAAFSAGKVDLAVVRGDVGDLSQAQAVVVVSHMVVLIIAPPGSSIDSIDNLKGRTIGVVGGETNAKIVDVLTKGIRSGARKSCIQEPCFDGCPASHQSKQVGALFNMIPLSRKMPSRSFADFFSSTMRRSR